MDEKPEKDKPVNEIISPDFVHKIVKPELSSSRQQSSHIVHVAATGGMAALQPLLDTLPAAVYACEAPSGMITFHNEQAVKLWGRAPKRGDTDERFCGSFKLWSPDGTPLPHDQTPMAVTLRDGRSFRNEEVIIEQPDGTRINVLVNIDPICDEAGRVVGAVNAFHDVTPLRQAEQAQARLATIVETSDDAIVSKTLDGIIQSWNTGAERIFGYSASEAVGQPINLIIPAELQDEERLILEKLRKGEQIEHFETTRVTKTGQLIDISLTISPIRDVSGQIIGASKVARDVSRRKRTEQALKNKEAELELITETTPLILTRCSHDLRYLFANRAAAALFNLTPSEMIGRPIADVMGEKAFSLIRPHVEQVLRGEPVEFETEMPFPGGGPRWVSVNYSPERDEDGSVVGWVASIVDISKRKRAEEALRRLTETLEERVSERTKQVRKLASELLTAEQSIRKHIAYLLHDDLQQLLFAVEVQLGFFRDDVSERDDFNEVSEMVCQAINMTRQLSVELSPPVLENAGLDDLLAWLSQYMDETYQLSVTIETGEPPPQVSTKQGNFLYHIVRELLFNVVKHAGVQEAKITLQKAKKGISVTISDQGQGFEPANLVSGEPGHFGLRSVQERLELFGGKATIDSRPGAGTRITLFLPSDLNGQNMANG